MSKSISSSSSYTRSYFKEIQDALAKVTPQTRKQSKGEKAIQYERRSLVLKITSRHESRLPAGLLKFVRLVFPVAFKTNHGEKQISFRARRKAHNKLVQEYKKTKAYVHNLLLWNELVHGYCACGKPLVTMSTPWSVPLSTCSLACKYEKVGRTISKVKKNLFSDPEYKSEYLSRYEKTCLRNRGVNNAMKDPSVSKRAGATLKANHKNRLYSETVVAL